MDRQLRRRLEERFSVSRPEIAAEQRSADGTWKWLLRFADGQEVETVFIPEDDRGALCVSTQVGCTLTCSFCHTGTMPLVRNLAAPEIAAQILVARDGNQGLAMAEREDPDLLILDMMMPKRSGFLVLEKLRRTRPVPMRVIMITANEGSRHKAYAEMLGVDDYIRKPFAMDRLMESVAKLLA